MKTEEKIDAIVTAYDLKILGIPVDIPEEARSVKISVTILEKYAPTFLERVSKISIQACFEAYKQKNPESNYREFRMKFLSTIAGFEVYKQTLANVQTKLPEKIDAEELQKFCDECNPGLTRVDPGRSNLNPNQIQVPKNFRKS